MAKRTAKESFESELDQLMREGLRVLATGYDGPKVAHLEALSISVVSVLKRITKEVDSDFAIPFELLS